MKWLLQSLLIAVIFIPSAAFLPVASFYLCRSSMGGQIVFWAGPWSAAFWALIFHVMVGSKFWRGRYAVLAWRESRGGYVRSISKSTMVMFGALFASYALELSVVFLLPRSALLCHIFPLFTYAPVAFTLWRAARG